MTEKSDQAKASYAYCINIILLRSFIRCWILIRKQLQAKVQQLDSDKLISELFHIGEPFLRYLCEAPKVLEEI